MCTLLRAPGLSLEFHVSALTKERVEGSSEGIFVDPESTPNNVFPKSECVYVSETCLPNAPRGSIKDLEVGDGSTATSGTPN